MRVIVLRINLFHQGFNPYFNGYTTFILKDNLLDLICTCFNPYFNGYTTFITNNTFVKVLGKKVSILILMDILLLCVRSTPFLTVFIFVSILILMDILLLFILI